MFLQMYAEGGEGDPEGGDGQEGGEEGSDDEEKEGKDKQKSGKFYTNEELDRLIERKLAQLSGVKEDDWQKVTYQFTQNYPANLKEEVEIAKTLDGVTSKATQLQVLSLVDDPDAEIEAIREEEQQAAAPALQALESSYRTGDNN